MLSHPWSSGSVRMLSHCSSTCNPATTLCCNLHSIGGIRNTTLALLLGRSTVVGIALGVGSLVGGRVGFDWKDGLASDLGIRPCHGCLGF